jgi:hypothetical protein
MALYRRMDNGGRNTAARELLQSHVDAAVLAERARGEEALVQERESRWKHLLQRLADCMEPSLFEEVKEVILGRGAVGRRICPTARERERCAAIVRSAVAPELAARFESESRLVEQIAADIERDQP